MNKLMTPENVEKYGNAQQADKVGLSDTNALLCCPFCGGEAKLHTDGITAITCKDCSCTVTNNERGIAKLKGQWNNRPRENNSILNLLNGFLDAMEKMEADDIVKYRAITATTYANKFIDLLNGKA